MDDDAPQGELPLELPEMPWDRKPSIFDHLAAHRNLVGPGLLFGGEKLPDAALRESESILWAPGAMDGVLTHHVASQCEADQVDALFKCCQAYWEAPTAAHKVELYELLVRRGVVGWIDPLVERLSQSEDINHDRLYDVARSFALEAPDREPVKFGVALLGLYGQIEDLELFHILGRHDEFTLFCAVALANTAEDGEHEMWELGRNVDGWGRIHVVERLAETENPAVQQWLLREGYRNTVMYEYLAYTCAAAGKLREQLEAADIDDELFEAAGELLQALHVGGPAESLEDYEDGAAVALLYARHAADREPRLSTLLTLRFLLGFLDDDEADWAALGASGWTGPQRLALEEECRRLLAQPGWERLVLDALESAEPHELPRVEQAAELLGIDSWPHFWKRVQQRPELSVHWQLAGDHCPPEEFDHLIALAERRIPLSQLANDPAGAPEDFGPGGSSGPAENDMRMSLEGGEQWEWRHCLGGLLQALGSHPGKGPQFVAAGLRDALLDNRHLALQVLAQWGREAWPAELARALRGAAISESDEHVREQMLDLLEDR